MHQKCFKDTSKMSEKALVVAGMPGTLKGFSVDSSESLEIPESPWNFKDPPKILNLEPFCFKYASEMLQRCFRDASERLQRGFREASERLQRPHRTPIDAWDARQSIQPHECFKDP